MAKVASVSSAFAPAGPITARAARASPSARIVAAAGRPIATPPWLELCGKGAPGERSSDSGRRCCSRASLSWAGRTPGGGAGRDTGPGGQECLDRSAGSWLGQLHDTSSNFAELLWSCMLRKLSVRMHTDCCSLSLAPFRSISQLPEHSCSLGWASIWLRQRCRRQSHTSALLSLRVPLASLTGWTRCLAWRPPPPQEEY